MIKRITLTILLLTGSQLSAEEYPTILNWAVLSIGSAGMLVMDFHTDALARDRPHITTPNSVDTYFHDQWRWSEEKRGDAGRISDYMLFGVTFPAVFIVPAIGRGDYIPKFFVLWEIALMSGVLVRSAKFLTLRQRPDSYFSGKPTKGPDNLSFFSGHTSLTFGVGIGSAVLLAKAHPSLVPWFVGGTVALGTAIGYYRIAADRHYFSDVVVGIAVGTALGYFWANYRVGGLRFGVNGDQTTISKVLLRW